MKRLSLLLTVLLISLLAGTAQADCLHAVEGSYARQFGPAVESQESLSITNVCDIAWEFDLEQVGHSNGFTIDVSDMKFLNAKSIDTLHRHRILFYIRPGIGYHIGAGDLGLYTYLGAGVMFPLNHKRTVDLIFEVRQRLALPPVNFTSDTQVRFGFAWVMPGSGGEIFAD